MGERDAPGALNCESGFQQVDNYLTLSSAERGSHHEHGQALVTTDAREQELTGQVCPSRGLEFKGERRVSGQ
ncbi:MAG: hypothetical protein ABR557_03675 [Pyrinomonadaceae bacterium]